MKETCIPTSNEEDRNNIAEDFSKRVNFPNCIGAVDGKHIRHSKPAGSGSTYMNNKHFLSVVLLAVADSNSRMLM